MPTQFLINTNKLERSVNNGQRLELRGSMSVLRKRMGEVIFVRSEPHFC